MLQTRDTDVQMFHFYPLPCSPPKNGEGPSPWLFVSTLWSMSSSELMFLFWPLKKLHEGFKFCWLLGKDMNSPWSKSTVICVDGVGEEGECGKKFGLQSWVEEWRAKVPDLLLPSPPWLPQAFCTILVPRWMAGCVAMYFMPSYLILVPIFILGTLNTVIN